MSGTRLIVRNVLSAFGTQLVSWVLTFAVMLYVPRYLGVDRLGEYAFAGSLIVLVGAIVHFGTSNVLIRDIARDRSRTGELLVAAIVVRIPLACAMALAAILIGRLLNCPPLTRTFIVFMSFSMIIGTVNDTLASALQGHENLTRQSVAVIIEKLLSSAITIALVVYRAPFWTFAAVGILSGGVSLLVNLSAFASLLTTVRLPTTATIHYLVKAGMPFAGWVIFQRLYGASDPLVLGLVCNSRTVGWYAASFRLTGSTSVLPMAVCAALLPTLSRLYTENMSQFEQVARRSMSLIIICATPIAALFVFMPERLIALLHYPHEFSGSIPVLRIGGVGILFYYVTFVLGTIVVASDGPHKMFRASVAATLIGVPACFLGSIVTQRLWHNGAIGAVSSDILLEVYLIAAYLRMIPDGTFNNSSVLLFTRSAAAALPLAVLYCIGGRSGMGLWVVLPCIPIYILMCWRFRCLDPQLLEMLGNMVARRTDALP